MPHPNKPQLAFAWLGTTERLTPLWSAMAQTSFQGEPPQELLHRPQIIAANTETWSYRFSRCTSLRDLLYMRVNARRHAGVLWCTDANARPTHDERKMLCYVGASRLPVAVLLQNLSEGTEAAEQTEQQLRLLLDDLGFQADEATFVYSPSNESPDNAVLRLYQKLEQATFRLEEQALPPSTLRCEEAEFLFMIPGKHTLTAAHTEAPYVSNHRQPRMLASRHQWMQLHQADNLSLLRLRLVFEAAISLRPEEVFWGGLRVEQRELVASECVVLV